LASKSTSRSSPRHLTRRCIARRRRRCSPSRRPRQYCGLNRPRRGSDRGYNIDIFDTAGRQEIDQPLIEELKRLREFLQPQEILLVADAATASRPVSVATHFNDALQITGIVLTKLDGDARGGAALSIARSDATPNQIRRRWRKARSIRNLRPRSAGGSHSRNGRHRGFGRESSRSGNEEEAERLERKLRTAKFDFNDFLAQFKMMRKLGPLENILACYPE